MSSKMLLQQRANSHGARVILLEIPSYRAKSSIFSWHREVVPAAEKIAPWGLPAHRGGTRQNTTEQAGAEVCTPKGFLSAVRNRGALETEHSSRKGDWRSSGPAPNLQLWNQVFVQGQMADLDLKPFPPSHRRGKLRFQN